MWDKPGIREGGIGRSAWSTLVHCLRTLTDSAAESKSKSASTIETTEASMTPETPEATETTGREAEPDTEPDEHWCVEVSRPVYLGKSSVLDVLEANGGRLWQRELVEETDRPSSTISRWLCALEEMDAVERIQIGREKLVVLPEHAPQVAGAELPDPV